MCADSRPDKPESVTATQLARNGEVEMTCDVLHRGLAADLLGREACACFGEKLAALIRMNMRE